MEDDMKLASGRSIEVDDGRTEESITLRARDGSIVLEIHVTDAGLRLVASATDLELRAERTVRVSCERFALDARDRVDITSDHAHIEARRGDVVVTANDSVSLAGEAVLLNCDKPDPIEDAIAARARREFAAQLASRREEA
jgi:hypothetical protein